MAEAGIYTIGRVPSNSMRILDMKISKQHCEIRVAIENGRTTAVLFDGGSTTGCQLNDQPVPKGKPKRINPGDKLQLGLTLLRVLSEGEADLDAKPVAGRQVDAGAVAGAGRTGDEGKTKVTLPADALVGKELAGYQIDRKIGMGGMGGVYLAEQTSLQRKVALKVLNETFAADSAFVDQFVNEARAAGALNHPNVVQVYDVGNAEGHYFFSMEVMPGGSIEDKIKEGPVAWEDGLNWFLDAANALIFAKKREILHRDVKPDNLMIGEDESAKLCDLGLAKKSEVGDLMDQGIIGTPHFISPEAIRRKSDIDHRTDLYSLGCSFYRVFTGKNPYPGKSVKEILLGHLNKPIPRVSEVNRDVPKEIDEIVYGLMRKDPEDRTQSPEELLKELDKIRTKYNLEAHGIKPGSKKPLVIGGVLAAVAIGVAIWFATRPKDVEKRGFTPAEIARQKKAEQGNVANRLGKYVQKAQSDLLDLDRDLLEGNLGPDNYKRPKWGRLAKSYRDAAAGWQTTLETWQQEAKGKKAQGDEIIRGHYTKQTSELGSVIAKAKSTAGKKIDKVVNDFKATEKQRAEARTNALATAESKIKDYALKLKKALDEKRYVELETSVTNDELGDILKALQVLKFGEFALLTEKDINTLLDKHIPKQGDKSRGEQYVAAAASAVGRSGSMAVETAQVELGSKPGFVEFQKALKALDTWLATVPSALDKAKDKAPRVTAAWGKQKQSISEKRAYTERRLNKFEFAMLEADRATYFRFLVDLWGPGTGLLHRFELGVAKDKADKLVAELKHGKYRKLAKTWPAPLAALDTLFQDIRSTFPNGWTEKHTYWPDRNGKPRKETIKDIDATGIKIGRDTITFAELGARGVLDTLFFVEGNARLATCTPTHHVGLGLLFELAGDYEGATKQYKAAEMAGDTELNLVIATRTGPAGREKLAADKYLAVVRFLEAQEKFSADSAALLAGDQAKPGSLSSDDRGDIITRGEQILRDMASIQAMKHELQEDVKLAITTWGSSIREAPHPRANYAGERLPELPKKPVRPREIPPGKDGDGKKKQPDDKVK